MDGFAEDFGAWKRPGKGRELDGVKDFFLAPAPFLDAIRVSVKDFEDRERLKRRGQFARHVQRRRERHHRVKADVILTAKSAGVCKGCCGYELSEVGAVV